MSERKIGTIARELIAAKKRIENPENWCTFELHRVGPKGNIQHCALGAMELGNEDEMWPIVDEVASEHFGMMIHDVNNELGHAATMRMFDIAISKAISEGK